MTARKTPFSKAAPPAKAGDIGAAPRWNTPAIDAFVINPAEASWRSLFDGIADALLLMRPDGTLLEINRAATALLGYANDDVAGRHVSMLYPPSEEARIAACFDEVARNGISRYIDGVALASNGDRIAVDVVGSVITTGGQPTVIAVVRDISARKRAETDLHATQQHFHLLAEHIREIFWICDPNTGAVTYVSPAFAELSSLSGCATGTDVQCWAQSIVPPDRPLFDAFLATQARGEPAEVELRISSTDGGVRWLHGRSFPWRGDDGQMLAAGVAEDITERKQAEAQRLAQAQRQREMLVREVHHRMKNSLQGVIGLLRRCAGQHPALASALTGAIGQVRSIAVIHELQSTTTGAPVLLSDLLPMIASGIEGLFDTKVIFKQRHQSECRVILTESETVPLAIVLNELFMNAAKHQCGYGATDARPIEVELSGGADRALIQVSNPGELPPTFDFAARRGLGQGLELLSALLPAEHAELEFSQQDGRVIARLVLLPPIIEAHGTYAGNQGNV